MKSVKDNLIDVAALSILAFLGVMVITDHTNLAVLSSSTAQWQQTEGNKIDTIYSYYKPYLSQPTAMADSTNP